MSRLVRGLAAGLALALTLTGVSNAQQPVKTDHATASLIAERAAASPGDTFLAALKMDLLRTWHVYWRNPGDSGLPPTVSWKNSAGVQADEFKWPAPRALPISPLLMNYGYEDQLVLPFDVKIPKDAKPGSTVTVAGDFQWLICQDVCVPEKATLSLDIPVAAAPKPDANASTLIGNFLKTTPVELAGSSSLQRTQDGFVIGATDPGLATAAAGAKDIRFFPYTDAVSNPSRQEVKIGDKGVQVTVKASDLAKPGDIAVPGIVVVEGPDGSLKSWETQAQPGAPLSGIADKVGATKTAASGGAAASAAAPVVPAAPEAAPMSAMDLLLTLGAAFLGGLVLNLMPCVLPVLAIKAAGLVHTAHDPKESRAHGLAYLGGVLACFGAIGLIVVGFQVIGHTTLGLGFQLQYPPVVAFFALAMFAIGLNLLGVFEMGTSLMGVGGKLADQGGRAGAFFTGLVAAFVGAPCVGPFMAVALAATLTQPPATVMAVFLTIGLGLAAPFVLLSYTPAFAKVLPKPGKWMATFRQALAFPMFVTVLWLLWVIAGQAGSDGVILVTGGAILISFGIWLATKIGAKPVGAVLAGIVILGGFVAPSILSAGLKADAGTATLAKAAGAEPWSEERIKELQADRRVIFVDFTARWCVTCQLNKASSIDSAQVRKAFADNNVAFLVADWTNQDGVIAAELAKHGRAGVPLYLVYPATGGDPAILPQVLTPGLVEQAVKEAAGHI